jgi:chemotaxis protein MotB
MKKKHPQHENHERWLVSYADFITLLFAFFVVMFASQQTDRAKAKQVSDAVKEALENGKNLPPIIAKILGGTVDEKGIGNAMMKGPGGAQKLPKEPAQDEPHELLPSMKFLTVELEREIRDGKIEMHLESRGLVISLREATFFPSGDDTLLESSTQVIDKLVNAIRSIPNPISIEGHTDSVPIHNGRFPSNWELSAARSIALLNVLRMKYAIDTARLSVTGYADTQPLGTNETDAGRARNRRVDVVIRNITVVKKSETASKTSGKAKPSPAHH